MNGAIVVDLGEVRFQADVEKLHRLGPRPLHAMLVELGLRSLLRTEIEGTVRRYARLDPAALGVLGGDRWGPR